MFWGCASAPSAASIAASEADPREVLHVKTQASASTPGKAAEREIIRVRASESTSGKAERKYIRAEARASTVVGQARIGCEPWVIICGEGGQASTVVGQTRIGCEPWVIICGESTQASAARRRCRVTGREGALGLGHVL